ncbi:MAG: ATP-binding protein [Opitutales bacterium]
MSTEECVWLQFSKQSPDWLAVIDGEGRLLASNPAFDGILMPDTDDEGTHRLLADRLPNAEPGTAELVGLINTGSKGLVRRAFRWGDPPRTLLGTAWPLDDGSVAVACRPRAENGNVAEAEMTQEELNRFVYVAGHDLQEPLRTVTAYLQLLAKSLPESSQEGRAGHFLERALHGASRMKGMVYGLLEYTRASTRPTTPQALPLELPLQDALANLELAVQECGAAIEVSQPLPTVCGDAAQLTQVLQNLIGNALKFCRPEVAPQITVSSEPADGVWLVCIADNGLGVAEGERSRIFEIFQRLHRSDEVAGSGIGLAVCRRIVQRHGGQIWHEPNEPQGSRFCFTLLPANTPEFGAGQCELYCDL